MNRTFITLRQDNGASNPPGVGKLTVTTDENTLERHIKRVLGWRSATKRYNSIIERYRATGSHSYDKVILSIYEGVKR